MEDKNTEFLDTILEMRKQLFKVNLIAKDIDPAFAWGINRTLRYIQSQFDKLENEHKVYMEGGLVGPIPR